LPAQIAILHGWSDTSQSFLGLRGYLQAQGYGTTSIWLGDYKSMDDDVRIEDVGKRMERVVREHVQAGRLAVPFDLIVHSTGGLVARDWISRHYPDGKGCPVKRLIMLAPANFGSRLASMGKSMIGRLAKGWNNWFQTGTEMLIGLELGSAYQWDLARRDLLDPEGEAEGPYGHGKVWPFVIVGSRAYADGIRQIVNENGSDGTVRCAAANLNAVGMTVDFAADPVNPTLRPWHWRAGPAQFPLAILPDRNHSSIHEPGLTSGATDGFSARLGALIIEALGCDSDGQYDALFQHWQSLSETTADLARNPAALAAAFPQGPPKPEALHQYMQIVTFLRDDQGRALNDYFLEFFAPDQEGDAEAVFFHREVLEDVRVNSQSASRRCLFIDHSDLIGRYYRLIANPANRQVAVSISAAAAGGNVRYFDSTMTGAQGHLVVHSENEAARAALGGARLRRNCTHFAEIIVPRLAIDAVFTLKT
jgi:hypothetical protein